MADPAAASKNGPPAGIYTPSFVGAIIGTAVFTVLLAIHIFRMCKTRTKMCIPLIFAAFNEAAGYLFRALAVKNPTNMFLSQTSKMILLISPMMITMTLHMVLKTLILDLRTESYSPLKPKWIPRAFGAGDQLCLLMVGLGGMFAARGNQDWQKVLQGGLGIHMLIIVTFSFMAYTWRRRTMLNASPETKSYDSTIWSHILFLYVVCVSVFIRNAGRLAEFVMGPGGYLQHHEWPFYLYELVPVSIALGMCLKWYTKDLVGRDRERQGMLELTESNEEGRPTLQVHQGQIVRAELA